MNNPAEFNQTARRALAVLLASALMASPAFAQDTSPSPATSTTTTSSTTSTTSDTGQPSEAEMMAQMGNGEAEREPQTTREPRRHVGFHDQNVDEPRPERRAH